MQRGLTVFIVALCGLLGGCASTIRSEVTAFHDWPANLAEKSFAFEPTKQQQGDLEYRNYASLVRAELERLGFVEAADGRSAHLKLSMQYSVTPRDVKIVQSVPADPFWHSPFYGPRLHGYGYHRHFYDPFWYGPPVLEQRETTFQIFKRQLKLGISQGSDSRRLYDVTVDSEGRTGSLATVMPYMVRSAFAQFPGKSGKPHRVELKMTE